jgi:hypothetical protein
MNSLSLSASVGATVIDWPRWAGWSGGCGVSFLDHFQEISFNSLHIFYFPMEGLGAQEAPVLSFDNNLFIA